MSNNIFSSWKKFGLPLIFLLVFCGANAPVAYAQNDSETAVLFVIDRSYSMKGNKIQRIKGAIINSLDQLQPEDYVGVVAFDSQPYVPVPVEPVKSKKKVEALINRIEASGQTNIYPGIGIAYRLLRDLTVTNKHVVLISDGDTAPAEFQRLIERMTDTGMLISSITIGEDGNPGLMKQLSEWGGGKSFISTSPHTILDYQVTELVKWALEQEELGAASPTLDGGQSLKFTFQDPHGATINYEMPYGSLPLDLKNCNEKPNVEELVKIYQSLPDSYSSYVILNMECITKP